MLRNTTASFDFDAPLETTAHLHCPTKALKKLIDGKSMLVEGRFTSDINSRGKIAQRQTVVNQPISVYRNLNKPSYFSCKQNHGELKGKVSGYANIIVVEQPEFVISEKSRQRVLSEESRNVHAYVKGTFVNERYAAR